MLTESNRTAKDEMLARVLGLLVSALTSRTQLKALIITQVWPPACRNTRTGAN